MKPRAEERDPKSERPARDPVNSEKGNSVAVLVVHGVAAKVPNREFANLEAVTKLLTFQNENVLAD